MSTHMFSWRKKNNKTISILLVEKMPYKEQLHGEIRKISATFFFFFSFIEINTSSRATGTSITVFSSLDEII